jgi:restriction endonuclease S subunit/predicted nucleic acid-binding protein
MMFYKETIFRDTEIGRIPEDWEVVKLGTLLDLRNGERPKIREGASIPVYGANGIMGYTDNFLVDNDFTIIIGRVGASGEIHLGKGKIWVSDNAIFSKSYDATKIYPPFLFYLLKLKRLNKFVSKTTHPIITQTFLSNFLVQLPELKEQQKIAEVLSTVDEAIQKTNEIIAKTERLKKGLMQELLTKGLTLGFMFDTNVFNAIIDNRIDLRQLPRNLKYYVTHIQYDEICSTQNEERKRELLEIMEKVPNEVIATEGAVYGVSRYGMAKFMSEADAKQYDEMLRRLKELDEEAGKKKLPENQARDVLIALTSIKNCLVLVTEDKNLKKVTEEFNGQAITLEQFQKREYREFKDTEIGRIPKHWKVVKVGDVLSLEYGRGLPEKERIPGMYPVVGSNGIVGYHNQAIVKGPGIVMGRKGTIGAVSWIDKDFWPIDTTYYVKTKVSDVFLKWLFYELIYLNPARFHLADVVPGLKRELVHSLKMPLPPLQEQQKIAEILSIIDKKLEVEKNEKAKLEKIKQGLMDLLLTGKIRVRV